MLFLYVVGYVEYNIATSGYIVFQNGLIVQWGYINSNNTGYFPVTFPTNNVAVCTHQMGSTEGGAVKATSIYYSRSEYYIKETDDTSTTANWLAIGY